MRILKYSFLILLLSAFAGVVYVATQRGDYQVEQSTTVPVPKSVLFQYLNDYYNWEQWYANADGTKEFSSISAGNGAFMRWESAMDNGYVKTISADAPDSLRVEIVENGLPAEALWVLRESDGATRITLTVSGKMGFMPKVDAVLRGGPERVMGDEFEKLLESFKKVATSEIGAHQVKIEGLVQQPSMFYLGQTITSKISNLPTNIDIMMSNMLKFFQKNKIEMSGSPFVLYDYFNPATGLTRFTVCIPVGEEIFVAPGSDIKSGKVDGVLSLKSVLKGHHSHLPQAWEQTFEHIRKNNLKLSETGGYLEIYKIGKNKEKRPSGWVTELYIPVDPPAPEPAAVPAPVMSQGTAKPSAPRTANTSSDPEKANNPLGEIEIP